MSTLLIAGCVILKDGKILLVRKSDRDFWELPGGYAKEGEEEQVAVEKTKGQIGVEPTVIQQFTVLEFQKDGKNIEAPIFECDLDPDAAFKPGEGVAEVRWFDLESADKENVGADVKAILEEL
ncbi:TPA: NUDIX hydrolase [Candidatus Woesearchaeota archaeon]|nr:NUDIX hydrolase [Candidatus Woesearchaeota archaeon]